MNVPNLLAVLTLVVGAPLTFYQARRLRRLALSSPDNRLLRFLTVVGEAVLLVVVVFGLIFLNNDLPSPVLSGDATKYITRGAVLVLAIVPALYLRRLYRDRR